MVIKVPVFQSEVQYKIEVLPRYDTVTVYFGTTRTTEVQ